MAKENVESAEKVEMSLDVIKQMEEEGKNVIGFGVNNAPIWLFRELFKEAKKYHNGSFWVTLVDWYRKAKQFEHITAGGIGQFDDVPEEIEKPKVEEKKKTVALMGGHVGV